MVEAVRKILEEGGEPDDVLRAVVNSVSAAAEVNWVGIAFAEGGTFVLGPSRGDPEETRRERISIAYDGAVVGELWADGPIRLDELEQVAALICAPRPHRLGHGRRGLGALAANSLLQGAREHHWIEGVPRSRDCVPHTGDYKVIGERGREPRARPMDERAE